MSDEEKILEFISFCAEIYAKQHIISGSDAMALFAKSGTTEYLRECYEPLHTQGESYILSCVEDFLGEK